MLRLVLSPGQYRGVSILPISIKSPGRRTLNYHISVFRPLCRGFSLIELLVVVTILAILAALLFPVFASAKTNAQKPVCTSHLRQAVMSLNAYLESSDGIYPSTKLLGKTVRATPVVSSAKTGVFHCPLDRPEGQGGLPFDDRQEPLSYMRTWLLWEGDEGVTAWNELIALDPNPVVLRCGLHDDSRRARMNRERFSIGVGFLENFASLAARKDGSVKFEKRGRAIDGPRDEAMGISTPDVKASIWSQATDVPCTETICDGKAPVEGWKDL
ncbi:type II secretion system protein [bacterium]|nr:MAG: type II secretion system protein [bacterium]